MIENTKISLNQGRQYIIDVRSANLSKMFRGFPILKKESIQKQNENICPAGAITADPFSIDMGKCVFCGKCERNLGRDTVEFTNEHRLSSSERNALVVTCKTDYTSFRKKAFADQSLKNKTFKRSLKLRSVSAGGCNGCELELNASSNVNFDMQRFGIDVVASPRHADGMILTGPITENMAYAVEETYESIPEPKIIILMGSCAISGGVFASSKALERSFAERFKVDLFVPGCPAHPLTLINGILDYLK